MIMNHVPGFPDCTTQDLQKKTGVLEVFGGAACPQIALVKTLTHYDNKPMPSVITSFRDKKSQQENFIVFSSDAQRKESDAHRLIE